MPSSDFSHPDRPRWRERFPHPPPRWWPEGEEWPPRCRWHMRRKPFFRRLGCFFLGFAFLGMIGFIAIAGLIAEALGFMHTPFGDLGPIYPVGIGIFLLMFVVIAWGARSLRRMSMPLDDLLEAARRVADGDYSARV